MCPFSNLLLDSSTGRDLRNKSEGDDAVVSEGDDAVVSEGDDTVILGLVPGISAVQSSPAATGNLKLLAKQFFNNSGNCPSIGQSR